MSIIRGKYLFDYQLVGEENGRSDLSKSFHRSWSEVNNSPCGNKIFWGCFFWEIVSCSEYIFNLHRTGAFVLRSVSSVFHEGIVKLIMLALYRRRIDSVPLTIRNCVYLGK
jgi:hypothetical protein